MIHLSIPAAVAVLGAVVHLAAPAKWAELGKMTFAAALLAILMHVR